MSIDFRSSPISSSYIKAASEHRKLQKLDQDYSHPLSQSLGFFNRHLLSLDQDSSYSPPSTPSSKPFATLLKEYKLSNPDDPLLAALDDSIPGLDATKLIQRMKTGTISVIKVLEHFGSMALLSHKTTGCLSDFFPELSLSIAQSYDDLVANSLKGDEASKKKIESLPLFGLPVSIKGHIGIKGRGNQRGFIYDVLDEKSRLNVVEEMGEEIDEGLKYLLTEGQGGHAALKDAPVVEKLKELGGLLYCKTTMPQS